MEKTNTSYTLVDKVINTLPEIERRRNGFLKSIFGSKYTLTYRPTGAVVRQHSETYAPGLAEDIQRMVSTGMTDDLPQLIPAANGNVMIQAYISHDCHFCAIQALRFLDFEYSPVTEPCVYTGDKAKDIVCKITGKA
ncbi:MAG: hypothetical protein NC344_01740 [Bacteroidales bacterium]|nr:hypothetical protein [Bacteroidales bacterium]MCM1146557.1 hypothetical protein [Bacteroidales bacterium]MCM1205949.1 hypothetical protein [Bacillota bacterium]MCM1510173.1 hypothetical protein [Clostridium sp.]